MRIAAALIVLSCPIVSSYALERVATFNDKRGSSIALPTCTANQYVTVVNKFLVCKDLPSASAASIDYSDCENIYHSQNLPVGTFCGYQPEPGHPSYTTHTTGQCSPGYVMVEITTGLRFPGFCQLARSKCCKLK